ncbi:TetR/AcrR family transcriptional regulator [Actinomadura sp. 9N407]|uniref:TetR/AcrR family transcriptional regulator n=1 Tax=Actinomadura sp. 9N407 TaxID=3375154 RepID=UPI0037912F6B
MTTSPPRRLPRGRSALPAGEVSKVQRARLLAAMADAMSELGFVGTPVGEILKRAGVSRQSFYELFTSKLDCFMAAFDDVAQLMEEWLDAAVTEPGDPLERFERGIAAYVELLAMEPGYARLFIVESHAAGPEAIARRLDLQELLTERLAGVLEASDDEARFACRMIVAAVGGMVTGPLISGDTTALREVGDQIIAHVRVLRRQGVL